MSFKSIPSIHLTIWPVLIYPHLDYPWESVNPGQASLSRTVYCALALCAQILSTFKLKSMKNMPCLLCSVSLHVLLSFSTIEGENIF